MRPLDTMKPQHIAALFIATACVFVAGVVLSAQDRFTLKTPNGIACFVYTAMPSGELW